MPVSVGDRLLFPARTAQAPLQLSLLQVKSIVVVVVIVLDIVEEEPVHAVMVVQEVVVSVLSSVELSSG